MYLIIILFDFETVWYSLFVFHNLMVEHMYLKHTKITKYCHLSIIISFCVFKFFLIISFIYAKYCFYYSLVETDISMKKVLVGIGEALVILLLRCFKLESNTIYIDNMSNSS